MKIRTPVIAGNWKLNFGPTQAAAYFAEFLPRLREPHAPTIAIFPPSLSLAAARDSLRERPEIMLGVQNIYWEDSGAFTGEISAPLAADAGADLVLVGHSERRHTFGESDAETGRKLHAALAAGLSAVFCVGETLDEREAGTAFQVVQRQLAAALDAVQPSQLAALLIAYEPVWAIGTGRTASPADAAEMHRFLRQSLDRRFAAPAADIPLLYGGSVKLENAPDLLQAPDVEGLLIGGASLDPHGFAAICSLRPVVRG